MYSEQEEKTIASALLKSAKVYSKILDADIVEIYLGILSMAGLTVDEVRSGIALHFMESQHGDFFPKPADIIRAIKGSVDNQAVAAWVKVTEAVKRRDVSSMSDLVFDDPKINWCINRMGGIGPILTGSAEQKESYSYKFQKYYKVAGFDPAVYASTKIRPPVMIGDPDKCQALLATGKDAKPDTGIDLSGINKMVKL